MCRVYIAVPNQCCTGKTAYIFETSKDIKEFLKKDDGTLNGDYFVLHRIRDIPKYIKNVKQCY